MARPCAAFRAAAFIAVVLTSCGGPSSSALRDAAEAPGARDAALPFDCDEMRSPDTEDAGTDDAGDAQAVPTWTSLYEDYFGNVCYSSSCAGSLCHNPGHQMNVDLSTKQRALTSLVPFIVPGAPDRSQLMDILSSGSMPTGRPKMPPSDVSRVGAWIAAGAPDD